MISLTSVYAKLTSFQSARELMAAQWGQRLASAIKATAKSSEEDEEDGTRPGENTELVQILKGALRSVWKESPTDVFEG